MEPPKNPENETLRLASLYSTKLLDSPPEDRFDRYTRIAQKLYQVPIALISLIDSNRQWFKSCIGLPVIETSREVSFCGHAILHDDIFIVQDTLKDERFVDNPLVTGEPGIRFYAGVPLVLSSGMRLGTLCIIDNKPRELDKDDLLELSDLASILMAEMSSLEMMVSDPLTGLVNREGFMVLAENKFLAASKGNYLVMLVYLDIDSFKGVNDIHGRIFGDLILKDFAVLIQGVIRKTDVVARIGGDEFVILLNDSNLDKAEDTIAALEELIRAYNDEKDSGLRLSFSYGITDYDPSNPDDVESLLTIGEEKIQQQKFMKKRVV